LVGLVIGRSGENLRRVEKETGARIQFITPPDHKGPTRQCRISGTPRARSDAKREIDRVIEESNSTQQRDSRAPARAPPPPKPTPTIVPREGESAMQIMVPDRTVGLIIGRGGETIRDLQDRSGCHINIVGPNKSINGLRPVNLIGTPEAADHAKTLIMEIVDSDTRGPPGPVDTKQAPPPRFGNDLVQDDKVSEVVHVPPEAVGMIIGKSGETIREMQATTGCKINVSQGRGGPGETDREINLTGTRQAVEAARAAIMEKVDAVVCFPSTYVRCSTDTLQREKGSSRGRDGDRYASSGFGQNAGSAASGAPTDSNAAAVDPYAQWGGYQNYVAMWYSALASGATTGAPGQPPPPGGP
jgi:far upstream element-binding protein